MVNFYRDGKFWSILLLTVFVLMSISSKWFVFLDIGAFNYSILFLLALFIPNIKSIFREISNSQIESVKLPFCELRFSKKFDYYFLGERVGDENSGDMVVLAYYKNISSKKEAYDLLNEEYGEMLEEINIIETVKQVHYK